MKRRAFLKLTAGTGVMTIITPTGIVQAFNKNQLTPLEQGFINPGKREWPYCMWMWMNGQVTRAGITADLEAMARTGVGGVFNFESGSDIPKGPLQYLSEEWFDIKAFALKEAARLGLEFTMHNCPGWSSSGGPWIVPETSMKKTTWTKTFVQGGKKILLQIQQPETLLNFYKDIAVLAYPTLKNEDTEKPGQNNFTDWEKRANLAYNAFGAGDIKPGEGIIHKAAIIDISRMMNADGILQWDAPPGTWTILRIGFTTTGVINRAAPDTGIGLECDKYDAKAIEFHFYKMMDNLLPAIKPMMGKMSLGLEIDSYEVGMQNWTEGFEKEFEKRNGYSLIPFLPAIAGKLVESEDITDRVLWDLRRTQADMMADNYYGKFSQLCRKHDLISYIEPYDRGPMEEMQVGARADSNLGEYWNGLSVWLQNNKTMRRTPKLIASIAHVNGQAVAAVEAMTAESPSAKWQEYAFAMKPVCDHVFTMGINRLVFHRYAHQPHPDVNIGPGMTHGDWGIHFERTNTLWEVNKAWMQYLARCQSVLRRGTFAADLAYFTGEDPGQYTLVNRDELSPSPVEGYDYDVINAETLLNQASVEKGRLVLKSGMSYSVLVLQQHKQISLDVLRLVKRFVEQGLVVVGAKPLSSPGLKTYNTEAEDEFQKISSSLWNDGRFIWGKTLPEIFRSLNMPMDFYASSLSGNRTARYIHRKDGNTDIYFVANQQRSHELMVCQFRVTGKQPELWDPVTGARVVTPVFTIEEKRTIVAFTMDPYQSLFVVFRDPVKTESINRITKDGEPIMQAKMYEEEITLYKELFNNFTLTCWAKPEMEIQLSTRAYYENVKGEWTDFYTLYPLPGQVLYGEGHSTCGFTVGRNGVAVWEHNKMQPHFIVGCAASLEGWNHIAIVYEEGFPSVYLNGKLIGQGDKKTGHTVHPSGGGFHAYEGASYYNGDMTRVILHEEVLSPEKIQALSKNKPTFNTAWQRKLEPVNNGKNNWRFWENGVYAFIKAGGKKIQHTVTSVQPAIEITGGWKLSFPEKKGNPGPVELPELISLKDHNDPAVKYFSGTVNYQKQIIVPADWLGSDKRVFIDLGIVEVMAEVKVNGKQIGIFWTRPFLVDLTDAIKAGANLLEIKVTNQWVNRLIGDEQQPAADIYERYGNIKDLPEWYRKGLPKPDNGRVAFTTWKHFEKTDPLVEAGLIGPVMLRSAIDNYF